MDILEQVDAEFIKKLLKKYGSECYGETPQQLIFQTVCHGGDSHKLYYYIKDKLFMCYTNCGGMDVFAFVSKMENCTYKEAVRIVAKELGINIAPDRNGFKKKKLQLEHLNILSTSYEYPIKDFKPIEYFDPNTFYKGWIDEGISISSMEKFGIRWDEVGERIIIPCFDVYGNCVGVRTRVFDKYLIDKWGKYMPYQKLSQLYHDKNGKPIKLLDYSFSTSMFLYGLYENKDIIRKLKKAYVFEGEKSVLKCDSYFGEYPAVATYTHNISDRQLIALGELGVQTVILCYDYDGGTERENYKKLCKKIRNMGFSAYYLYKGYDTELDIHDAPVDQGKDVYIKLLKNKLQ